MAADTVDAVMGLLGRRLAVLADSPVARYSPTRRLPLWGADGAEELRDPAMAGRLHVEPRLLGHLAGRYGGEARALAAMIGADPALGEPLVPGLPYVRAEAVFAARYEMAHTLADVLQRRTRAWILDRAASVAAAPDVAALVAGELGWDEARIESEVDALTGAGLVRA
jgi:glycerol-3-phosphate dehydrogenase